MPTSTALSKQKGEVISPNSATFHERGIFYLTWLPYGTITLFHFTDVYFECHIWIVRNNKHQRLLLLLPFLPGPC